LSGFEVEAFELVIGAAAFDSGPFDDGGGGGAAGVTQIGLLIHFFGAGAVAAVGKELVVGESCALNAVDDINQAELDSVGHGDVVIEIPGALAGAGLLGELVEFGVFAVVGGPDGDVVPPSDAALGGLPEEFGVGVFGEFVQTNVAAVNGHGLRMGGEGDDAGTVVEFDGAHFDFLGEAGGAAFGVKAFDFNVLFSVRDDAAGEVKELGEFIDLLHVFQSAGPVFGGEKVIAFLKAKAFAHVFEAVGVGPADADGFFGERVGLLLFSVDGVLALDPVKLVRHEMAGEFGVGVDGGGGENSAHDLRSKIYDLRHSCDDELGTRIPPW